MLSEWLVEMGCGASAKSAKDQPAADQQQGQDQASKAPVGATTASPAQDPPKAGTTAATDAAPKPDTTTATDAPASKPEASGAAPASTDPKEGQPTSAVPADAAAGGPSEAAKPPERSPDPKSSVQEEESEDEGEDTVDDEQMEKKRKEMQGRKREGVMAEAWKPDADWKPPVNPKSDEQRSRIQAAVSRPAAFMFRELGQADLETVISAFQEHRLTNGSEVIKQGAHVTPDEPGLFVIESGQLDVFKAAPGEEHPGKKVFTYDGQGQFGELALLYNAPRAATVVATNETVIWSIDRNTFNFCVKEATMRKAAKYEQFLASVSLLSPLEDAERSKIADVLEGRDFKEDDVIIREGEKGDEFFIIEDGKAVATKDGAVVKEYGPTSYFGELALISSQTRQATVVAKATPTRVLCLERATFKRLLGSLEEMMRENAKEYSGPLDGTGAQQ